MKLMTFMRWSQRGQANGSTLHACWMRAAQRRRVRAGLTLTEALELISEARGITVPDTWAQHRVAGST
jgi:hypothetical protein